MITLPPMPDNNKTSLGLTVQEWSANFEKRNWTAKIANTLAEVADAPDATTNQRAEACKLLCMLANENVIPHNLPDGRHISQVVADTCISCLDGAPAIALAKPDLLEEARANYTQRIRAVEFTLVNAAPQLLQDGPGGQVQALLEAALGGNPNDQGSN